MRVLLVILGSIRQVVGGCDAEENDRIDGAAGARMWRRADSMPR